MEADKLLFEQFLDGNIDAFEQIVLKHKDNLIYFLQRYVKDIYVCEDIAQDVFAYIFVYKEKYNKKYSVKTYIYTIAKNKAIDYIRKFSRQVSLDDYSEQQSECDELFSSVVRDDTKKLLHETMKKLKTDYQTIIHLVDFEEMSYNDAAAVMGKTTSQIKILLFRARKSLKTLLEREGYTHEK